MPQDNMHVSVEGDELVIRVDLRATVQQTRNGNEIVGTSGNWVRVPGREDLSMNAVVVRKQAYRRGNGRAA